MIVVDEGVPEWKYLPCEKVGQENMMDCKMIPEISSAEKKHDAELIDVFEEEVNEAHASVANSLTPEENISIVCHKYHAGTLEYLVHDAWDCMWIQH